MPRILVLAKTGFGKTTSLFAVESLGFIGLDNKIPWNCPEDLKHFKKLVY